MCGINCIYRYTNVTHEDVERLEFMNREMAYRGPDGKGVWTDEKCGMAHTRLSIIGLENGAQPLVNEENTLVLVCNGEIYNYVELKEDLSGRGHVFRTDSDSEVILHLYAEMGERCVEKLKGMFAFLLWDRKRGRLMAARDRMGEKPLYYSEVPCGVVWSSELKAISKYWLKNARVRKEALAECVRYNYAMDLRNTWIEQVKRLEGGEYAIVDDSGMRIERYWSCETIQRKGDVNREEAMKVTLDKMRESVDMTLRSDVPVAVLLSGGIDSTTIAALAKETGREVHVICAGYKGHHDVDERIVAKRFAKDMGLVYHEVELDVEDFKRLFNEYIQYIDEPICDVASMAQWALYKKASEMGFKVLLSGVGGDELFFGYPYHNQVAESLMLRRELHGLLPWKTWGRRWQWAKWMSKHWKWVLTGGHSVKKIDDRLPVDWTYDAFKCVQDTKIGVKNYGLGVTKVEFQYPEWADIDTVYECLRSRFMNTLCLYLADRLGMGNSLEIRCPLLDYELWEYVKGLPLSVVYDGRAKGFMRDMMRGVLPDYILDAGKRGFTPPMGYIKEMEQEYNYKALKGEYVFFNTIVADEVIYKLGIRE